MVAASFQRTVCKQALPFVLEWWPQTAAGAHAFPVVISGDPGMGPPAHTAAQWRWASEGG